MTVPASLPCAEPLPNRVQELCDRAELAALTARYLSGLDEGRFDQAWANALFTDEIAMTFPVGSHQGADGVVQFTRTIMGRWARTHHHGSPAAVELNGDRADVQWSVIATHVHVGSPPPPGDTLHFQLGGRFDASARRMPTGWRFDRLRLRITWSTGTLPAHAPAIDTRTLDTQATAARPSAALTQHKEKMP